MTPENRHYFASLSQMADAGDIERFGFTPPPPAPDGWVPCARECHANAARWAGLKPGRKVVRGWLISGEFGAGGYQFDAHSVGEENGMLIDITPRDTIPGSFSPQESPRLSLRHQGSSEFFDALLLRCASIKFMPGA